MSTTTIDNTSRTFVAGEAISAYTLVKLTSDGTVDIATATASEAKIGYTVTAVASGEAATISLIHGGGSSYATASEAIAIGAIVYGADDGEVSSSGSSGDKVGVAVSAASASGDIIEVLPIHS